MKIRSLMALPALAVLAACAADPPPPIPVAAAAPPPVAAPPPPPAMTGMDGRYVGLARLAPGSPRSCNTRRTVNVQANVTGNRVMMTTPTVADFASEQGAIEPDGSVSFSSGKFSNARFSNGMIVGDVAYNNCRYTLSLRKTANRLRRAR